MSAGWQPLAAAWLDRMLEMSWQVALLVLVLAALDRLLAGRAAPRLRHALWMLVAVKLVLPPGLPAPWRTAVALAPAGAPVAEASLWPAAALAAWALGVVLLATCALVGARRLRRDLERGAEPASSELRAIARRVARGLGLRDEVTVRVTSCATGPLVLGLVRPVVYVPRRALARWSPEALEHVLWHEIAHVRRGDLWIEACFATLATLHWFHPAVWWARRHAHGLREMCADATAAAASGPGYRETLARISADVLLAPAGTGAAAFGGRRSWTLARLRELQRVRPPVSRLRRLASAAFVVTLGAVLVPMGARHVDVDRQVREAREDLARVLEDGPGVGSLHVRYATMRLAAAEAARDAASD